MEVRVIRFWICVLVLGAGLMFGRESAAQPSSVKSLVSESMLQSFRAESGCSGQVSDRLGSTLLAEDALAEGLRVRGDIDSLQAGKVAAVDYDRAASIAAAKGCKDLARRWWQELVRTFPEDLYADQRQAAEAGLARLPPESQAER